jgi:hypothetical protein
MRESPGVHVTSAELELDSLMLLELGALASDELLSTASEELLSETFELELSALLSELDSMPEPLSHGQPDSVMLSPLQPAQKKAVVVSKRFFQCLRMFIMVAESFGYSLI